MFKRSVCFLKPFLLIFLFIGAGLSAVHAQGLTKSSYIESDTLPLDSVLLRAKRELIITEKKGSDADIATAHLNLGKVFLSDGNTELASEHLYHALNIFESLSDDYGIARAKLFIGNVYQFHAQHKEALNYFFEAESIFKSSTYKNDLAEVFHCIGNAYEKMGDFEKARAYQFNALPLYQALLDQKGQAQVLNALGSIAEDEEEFKEAYTYFLKAASLDSSSGSYHDLINTLNNLGDVHRKQGRIQNGIFYTSKALFLADSLKSTHEMLSAYRDLSKLYAAKGDLFTALSYQDSAYQYSKLFYNERIASQIANFRTLYDLQKSEVQIAQMESKQSTDRLVRNVLIGFSVLVITGLAFIIWQERAKRMQQRSTYASQVALQKERIKNDELKQETLTKALENKELKEQQYYVEMENQQKELTGKVLHIIKKNRILKELNEQLGMLEKDSAQEKKVIKKMKKTISTHVKFEHDWDDLEVRFGNVHKDFIDRLKQSDWELTGGDLRLAVLMRMELGSEDIAMILGISRESLRIARHRLKKKLQLDGAMELKRFIEAF